MSMKVTRLYTYWSAHHAHTVIEFLDILRDDLWAQYGDEIIEAAWEDREQSDADQLQLPGFDDDLTT